MPRIMEVATPLDPDLLFHGMTGSDEMSRLSEYQLSMLSLKNDLDLNEMLGQKVTVKVVLADDSIREFNGYVTRIAQHGATAGITATSPRCGRGCGSCRGRPIAGSSRSMTVPEIVKTVFADHPSLRSSSSSSPASTAKWHVLRAVPRDRLQLRQPPAGARGHLLLLQASGRPAPMVMADSYSAHEPFPGYEELPFIITEPGRCGRTSSRSREWDVARRGAARGLRARSTTTSRSRAWSCSTQKAADARHTPRRLEVYDYPGLFLTEAGGRAARRGPHRRVRGRSSRPCRARPTRAAWPSGSLFTTTSSTRGRIRTAST